MTVPALAIVVALVLLGGCVLVGFLAGVSCEQERTARRRRRELRDRARHSVGGG